MNRREFVPIDSAATCAANLGSQPLTPNTRPGYWAPRIAESLRSLKEATLRWAAQMGIEWVRYGIPRPLMPRERAIGQSGKSRRCGTAATPSTFNCTR